MMKLLCILISSMFLTGCSSLSLLNKNKFKNVGSVTNYPTPIDLTYQDIGNKNSILNKNINLATLLTRRISTRQNGTFLGILIDSLRDSYIEASIISHNKDNILFHVNQSSLSKLDSFEFNISFNFSDFKTRDFNRTANNSYNLSFRTLENDTVRVFQISKSNNFIVQENLLELMTGEITNPAGNRAKFIAINDLHDSFESLTGLCLIFIPDISLLKLKCKNIAANTQCPKDKKPFYTVIKRNYFVARDYYCEVECK